MKKSFCFTIYLLWLLVAVQVKAQSPLSKIVTLDVKGQRIDYILELLSSKSGVYFSYNSNILKKDSLVSIYMINKPLKDVLAIIFNKTYEFKETGNYIVIRKAPIKLIIVTQSGKIEEKFYVVSGHVYDDQTKAAINDASIYEKKLLLSTLTNQNGFFKLKLRSNKIRTAALTVSKVFYEDATVEISTSTNQSLTITLEPINEETNISVIKPDDYLSVQNTDKSNIDTIITSKNTLKSISAKVENTGIAKFFIPNKQNLSSLNFSNFFTLRPYQISFTPGFSTHGKMSSQVVNNFSFNILGGYTGGTDGFEIGGLVNINKLNAQYFQIAGLSNLVGGSVAGVQVSGINNLVLGKVNALQISGINNFVKGEMNGVQIAGINNQVKQKFSGVQLAGILNSVNKNSSGVQIAGIANIDNQYFEGIQVAGILNYTKKLKGVQIGLINIADTSSGYSIGLINIIRKGYHKLSIGSNEFTNLHIALKTGNAKLYGILMGGINISDTNKIYSYGYGIGTELLINAKKTISINPELSSQVLYLGSWDYSNILNRISINLNIKIGKYISIFSGPSYNLYVSNQTNKINGYQLSIPSTKYTSQSFNSKLTGWIGWNFGVNLF